MDLNLNPEQEAVRDAIRGVLADRSGLARVRALVDDPLGADATLWHEAGGLGWFGLAVPEDAGGAGYGLPEAMLLFVELGRALTPGPWLGTVLAAEALRGTVRADVLAGRLRVAVIDDPDDAIGREALLAPDAGAAHGLLVLGSRQSRFVATETVLVEVEPSMDPTRRLGRVTVGHAQREPLDDVDTEHLRSMATVLAAAEAVGVAERALEMSVEYGKVRQQFGKPIGSFQAIKHRCADMAVRTEAARSLVTYAAVALRDGEPDAALHVRGAKVLALNAAILNTTDNVQNHGGMGYTWEGDAHLYLKRARLLEHTFGTRTAHLDAIADVWRSASR